MQSRIALVGRDLERLMATSQRTTSLRTDRGTTRRNMALQARQARAENAVDPELDEATLAAGQAADEATEPRSAETDELTRVLPSVFPWTRQDDEAYWNNEFGWAFAHDRDPRIPDTSLLTALHYFVAKFYETRGQLPDPPAPADAEACRVLRASPPELLMDVGDDVWHFWAAHSIGTARSMVQGLHSSALVALAAYVEEYTQRGARADSMRMPETLSDADELTPESSARLTDADLREALHHERRSLPRRRRVPRNLLAQLD